MYTKKFNLLNRFSSSNHWLVTQNLLEEMTNIASQPIYASTDDKEALFTQFLNTIYCGYFDELEGGLILDEDLSLLCVSKGSKVQNLASLYFKPLSINLSLCRLLLASDLVFYHGEFVNIANKILSHIIASTTNSKNCKLTHELYSPISDFQCSFTPSTLNTILKEQEIALFRSLSKNKTINDQQIYTQCCSLKDASSSIKMNYKEAQVVEQSIKQKLSAHLSKLNKNEAVINKTILDPFQINCELIEVVCDAFLFRDNPDQRILAEKIFFVLEQEIINDIGDNLNINLNLLNLICSGISLLTINFNSILLERVLSLIESYSVIAAKVNESNQLRNDRKLEYQKTLIITFLKSLPIQVNYSEPLLQFIKTESDIKDIFNFVFINQQSVDIDQQITLLNSKYNVFQKIFIYS